MTTEPTPSPTVPNCEVVYPRDTTQASFIDCHTPVSTSSTTATTVPPADLPATGASVTTGLLLAIATVALGLLLRRPRRVTPAVHYCACPSCGDEPCQVDAPGEICDCPFYAASDGAR